MVAKVPLTIACGDYDRVAAIKDGRVEVEGCEVTFIPMEPEEVFFRAFRFQEFDACELSFSSFMIVTSRDESPFVGIPAFVSRVFRHSGIYIRTDRGIDKPEDLRGKTVGLPEYQMTAPVWMRGMMEDEYGVKPNEIHWRSGGQEEAGRDERTPLVLTNGVDLQPIPEDKTLVELFEAGELDALMTARAPSSFLEGKPNIARLFPGLPSGRAGLLAEDQAVPDHAPDGGEEVARRAIPLASGEPLQGSAQGEGDRAGRGAGDRGPQRHAALGRGRGA